jgi:NDP-sugar pyrophosphorylase family protein
MSVPAGLQGINVAVLAGGLGTRVAGILGETPKVLAPVGGRTFLDHLLDHLAHLGAGRVILCLGHLADAVIEHVQAHPSPLPLQWVVEPEPLGTAGALALARPLFDSDPVLVMNGDTWLAADFAAFLVRHHAQPVAATLLCVPVPDIARYGAVEIDDHGHVLAFSEKGGNGPGWINGGAMLLSKTILDGLPGRGSLERDVLAVLPPGQLGGFAADGAKFIDIGTPETLRLADTVVGQA